MVTFLGEELSWKRAANDDATFKSAENLKAIYEGEAGLTPDGDTIVYCRIGERSEPHLVRVDLPSAATRTFATATVHGRSGEIGCELLLKKAEVREL